MWSVRRSWFWYAWRRSGLWRWQPLSSIMMMILIALAAYGLAALMQGSHPIVHGTSPWPPDLMRRHQLAARNCDAARSVGLAPSRRGEPGYYPWHDADNDGIACEPWPRHRTAQSDDPTRYPRVIPPGR